MDDVAHARALCDQLGGTFCLTYLKGVDAAEALRRLGGYPDTIRERPAAEVTGQPRVAAALVLDGWAVVIEPGGVLGADHALLEAASRGSAAVSVLRHDAGAAHFGYVVSAAEGNRAMWAALRLRRSARALASRLHLTFRANAGMLRSAAATEHSSRHRARRRRRPQPPS